MTATDMTHNFRLFSHLAMKKNHEKLCPVDSHHLDYSAVSLPSPTPLYSFIIPAITLARHSMCSLDLPIHFQINVSDWGY
jgi:hypothetical protein